MSSWDEYGKLVLAELQRLDGDMKQINAKLDNLKIDIVTLKIKSSLWGALAGTIPLVVFGILKYMGAE